eukprot:TRINITY_DN3368_c1_g1_i1.p1 TRINITY_DN3368_c1_g1~~TRINITY_DN3368_c1_g1_i1.p1  ORF type:complete len:674 (-),score=232.26 TRINITY_DN3368_c1_g1_i1:287-2308(-)
MGNNHCKQLHIRPGKPISTHDFERLWQQYDDAKVGLGRKQARKFLKDLAEAVNIAYSKKRADKLIDSVLAESSVPHGHDRSIISYEQFKSLFRAAVDDGRLPQSGLTDSLRVCLKPKSVHSAAPAGAAVYDAPAGELSGSSELSAGLEDPLEPDPQWLEAPELQERCAYMGVTPSDVDRIIDAELTDVSKIIGLPESDTALVLRTFRWDKDRLCAKFFDKPDAYLEQAGVMREAAQTDPPAGVDFMCPVCMSDVPFDETFALGCGHRSCIDCWRGHVRSVVDSYGTQILTRAKCMFPKCPVLMNKADFRRVADATSFEKYCYFYRKSFIEGHVQFTFCPRDCGNAVKRLDATGCCEIVQCLCGNKFCFDCGAEYHKPVTCEQLSKWGKKNHTTEEEESLRLVTAIAKPCPNPACGFVIERTDGCNHMSCNRCAHEWCWQCREPWARHGERTGGYYYCNRYDSSKAAELDREADAVRDEHNRYLHYFNGFFVNDRAEKGTMSMRASLVEKAKEYKRHTGGAADFLLTAFDTLIECRHIVKFTYIYAFFLPPDDSNPKLIFEEQQAYAQKMSERLAKELLRTPEDIDRSKVVYLHKACKQYFDNLVAFFESDEAAELYSRAMHSYKEKQKQRKKREQTSFWSCASCTYGNSADSTVCDLCRTPRNPDDEPDNAWM